MPASESFRIPKHRRHVPTARQRVRKTLADWGITDELADAVTLLANELVTNAVTHCRVSHSQVKVELTLDGRELVLEVSDPDRDRLPRPHDSTPDEGGARTADAAGVAVAPS
ncbi:ATP-binding protein, partial [Streptomyces prunicolor]|uniref:ATP-binding protein n=1 Tax=Streptomyces prunicolor TaxID=67348 RepID=UPI0033ECF013